MSYSLDSQKGQDRRKSRGRDGLRYVTTPFLRGALCRVGEGSALPSCHHTAGSRDGSPTSYDPTHRRPRDGCATRGLLAILTTLDKTSA
jgi:hypothetical protein